MRRVLAAAVLLIGLMAIGNPAHALFVLQADADGIGVDDTVSGKEWLKLPLTQGQSINQAAAGVYGSAGFVVALTSQVHTLFVNAGFGPVNAASFITFDSGDLSNAVLRLLGTTENNFAQGWTKSDTSTVTADVAVVANTGQSQADAPGASSNSAGVFDQQFAPYGVWMLRDAVAQDVPEPTSIVLVAAGLAALAVRRRR